MLTLDDFNACGWKAALQEADAPGDYYSLFQAFFDAANQAAKEEKQTHGKVLRLLADVCSMGLSPESVNEPFKPCVVSSDGRSSMCLDDLSDGEIDFIAAIVDSIDNPLLKARMADIAWILHKPKNVRFAGIAIDNYLSVPLERRTWQRDGRKCWQRAINLAQIRGIGTDKHKSEVEVSIVKAFRAATAMDGTFGLEFGQLAPVERTWRG